MGELQSLCFLRRFSRTSILVALKLVLVFIASTTCSSAWSLNQTVSTSDQFLTIPIGKSGLPTLEMSESEFESWIDSRKRIASLLPGLSRESRINALPSREVPYRPYLAVELPERTEFFHAREITVNLDGKNWKEALEEIHYYPEIAKILFVWSEKGNPEYEPQEYENYSVPIEVAKATLRLPLLLNFSCYGGSFSEQFVKNLAAHPSIRIVCLGRCKISTKAFGFFERLRTLKELSVTVGASPEWFVTLAKLPDFRHFFISGKTLGDVDLNQPIDDETRKAIESLNGKLETFCVGDAYGIVVHADVARALFQVKSLKKLSISEINPKMRLEDLNEVLTMPNLTEFDLSSHDWGEEHGEASKIISKVRKLAEERYRAAKQLENR